MVDVDSMSIDSEILRLIPKSTAIELKVIPLSLEGGTVNVAVLPNYDQQLITDLAFLLGKKVKPVVVSKEWLFSSLQRFYGASEIELRNSESSTAEFLSVKEEEKKAESTSDGSAVTVVNRIISDAIRIGASDIHVEPHEKKLRVRYRIDGVLHEVLQPSQEMARPLISRLKIMADLDIAEKRRPQDGRIRVKEGDRAIDIRVSSLPTDFGEKIVLRILDKSQLQLDLTKLGFEDKDLEIFQKTVLLPYGMILVTGPTGSGKTTTLYAALNHINRPDINITTIEDPIEYNLPGINQTHVRSDIGLTFAAALRSILRQDPNVIMVGEIRDKETAEIAIRAALTGHLVFSTLHTNDAPSAITRLIDMGIEPFLVASSVKMILAQRLLRKLCTACKEPYKPDNRESSELGLKLDTTSQFYRKKGCNECNQFAYKGRTAVFEVFRLHNGLVELITKEKSANIIRDAARRDGILTLREAAVRKAERGETSLEEVMRETVI